MHESVMAHELDCLAQELERRIQRRAASAIGWGNEPRGPDVDDLYAMARRELADFEWCGKLSASIDAALEPERLRQWQRSNSDPVGALCHSLRLELLPEDALEERFRGLSLPEEFTPEAAARTDAILGAAHSAVQGMWTQILKERLVEAFVRAGTDPHTARRRTVALVLYGMDVPSDSTPSRGANPRGWSRSFVWYWCSARYLEQLEGGTSTHPAIAWTGRIVLGRAMCRSTAWGWVAARPGVWLPRRHMDVLQSVIPSLDSYFCAEDEVGASVSTVQKDLSAIEKELVPPGERRLNRHSKELMTVFDQDSPNRALVAALLLVGVAVLVPLAHGLRTSTTSDVQPPDIVIPKGGSETKEELPLSVYTADKEGVRLLADGDAVPPNAPMRFEVRTTTPCWLQIVSVNGDGVVSQLYPADGSSVRIMPDAELPGGARFDDVPGFEHLVAVCAPQAISPGVVEGAVQRELRRVSGDVRKLKGPLELPAEMRQTHLLIETRR